MIKDLKKFVNTEVKPLNDYLENNQRRIVEVTKIIEFETRTDNPVKYLLALNALDHILPELKNFKTPMSQIGRLIKYPGNKKSRKKKRDQYLRRVVTTRKSNYIKAENYVLLTINNILDSQVGFGNYKEMLFYEVINSICIFVQAIYDLEEAQESGQQRQKLIVKILNTYDKMTSQNEEIWWIELANILRSCSGIISLVPTNVLLNISEDINAKEEDIKVGKIILRDHLVNFAFKNLKEALKKEPKLFDLDIFNEEGDFEN